MLSLINNGSLSRLFDIFTIILSGFIVREFRHSIAGGADVIAATDFYLLTAAATSCILWIATGLMRRSILHATQEDITKIALVALSGPLVALMATFLLDRSGTIARSVPVLHILLIFGALLASRIVGRLMRGKGVSASSWTYQPEHHRPLEDVIVCGEPHEIAVYLRTLEAVPGTHFKVVGLLTIEPGLSRRRIRGHQILGSCSAVQNVLSPLQKSQGYIPRIIVAGSDDKMPRDFVEQCLTAGAPITRFGHFFEAPLVRNMGQLSSHKGDVSPSVRAYLPIKRGVDIIGSSVGILMALPIMLFTAMMVRLFLGGPILFWQWRPGRYGRPFKLYKFRSMRHPLDPSGARLGDAERLGKFGIFLRRTRFDEFPQLFHILLGDMSLLGPRPLIQEQQDRNGLRLALRPGLSGWAQVNGGHLVSDAKKHAMDVWYIEHCSLWLDVKIIVLTLGVILFGDRPSVEDGGRSSAEPDKGAAPALSNSPQHDGQSV